MKVFFVLLAMVFSLMAAVNINTAGKEELMSVKGIGEKKAEAIIAYRSANGAFKSVNDLVHVKGLGEKSVEAIKSELTVQ
ncbi:MAG: helix-hairpin-helix domain-containing protein [Campylobacterales bacterium]|nr:helix-hairpin-helix domain-containing protein [Campylobacterales bacterium]